MILNRASPNTNPWGISFVTDLHLNIKLLTAIIWVRPILYPLSGLSISDLRSNVQGSILNLSFFVLLNSTEVLNQQSLLQHTFTIVYNGILYTVAFPGLLLTLIYHKIFLSLCLKSLPVSLVIHRYNVHSNIILLVWIQTCDFHPHGWKHSPRKRRVEAREEMVNKEAEWALWSVTDTRIMPLYKAHFLAWHIWIWYG